MLSAIGVPPDASLYVTAVTQQLKYMLGLMITVYLIRIDRERHLRLPPGEQYRRHLREGGYIPC